jgi:hypothetical protein
MKVMTNRTGWLMTACGMFAIGALLAGCGAVAPTGDLDALTDDANNNGFLDVTPPDGVEFLTLDNINIRLLNTVTQDDLGPLAAQFGVDPALLNLVSIVANIDVTLDYGNGITDTISESESIEPFGKKFEIACPNSVLVDVNVVANAPIVGPQEITTFTVRMGEGAEYECGQQIEVEVIINDAGNPDVDVNVS